MIRLLCTLVALLLAPVCVTATPASPLRVLLGNAAPWAYFDQDCQPAGIGVDLMGAVSRRAAVPIEFVYVPYEEERAAFLDGRLDADINELNDWYDQQMIRIAPILALDEVLVGHAEPERADQALRRIGHVVTHNSRERALAQLEAEIVEFDSYQELAAAYLADQVDAVAGIKETLLFHLYRQGASPAILRTLRSLQTVHVWLYVTPRTDPALRGRLADALDTQALEPVLVQAKTMHLGAHRLRAPREPATCYPRPVDGDD